MMPNLRRARGDYVVKHFGVAYDDFRKEVWVSLQKPSLLLLKFNAFTNVSLFGRFL